MVSELGEPWVGPDPGTSKAWDRGQGAALFPCGPSPWGGCGLDAASLVLVQVSGWMLSWEQGAALLSSWGAPELTSFRISQGRTSA